MKFYTLDFDCNSPMTQQVNVPTNTDYKIGIKVKRNGAYQSLKPAEVTLGTLSADEGDVNGYTTFTFSAGDEASYTRDMLDIKHGYEEAYLTSNIIHNTTGANLTATFLSVDLSEYAGTTINATDVKLTGRQSNDEITEDALKEEMVLYWDIDGTFFQMPRGLIVDRNGLPAIWIMDQASKFEVLTALGWPSDKPAFFGNDPDRQGHYKMYETYTIQEGDKLIIGQDRRLRDNQYGGAMFQFTVGTPFDAKFKLNTNIFKSQQGDLDIVGAQASGTATLAGEYADGTEFSFEMLVK